MRTQSQLEAKYLGRRVKCHQGFNGLVTEVNIGCAGCLVIEVVAGAIRSAPHHIRAATHQVTLLKPKKEPITREMLQSIWNRVVKIHPFDVNSHREQFEDLCVEFDIR